MKGALVHQFSTDKKMIGVIYGCTCELTNSYAGKTF